MRNNMERELQQLCLDMIKLLYELKKKKQISEEEYLKSIELKVEFLKYSKNYEFVKYIK